MFDIKLIRDFYPKCGGVITLFHLANDGYYLQLIRPNRTKEEVKLNGTLTGLAPITDFKIICAAYELFFSKLKQS